MVQRMVELGLLRQLEPARLSGLNNLSLRFQNPSMKLNNRHFWLGTTGFLYNTQKLAIAPVDWDYLWVHQELSKRMALLNDVGR